MSEAQEDFAALTATFKFGGGFDAPWLVARGGDAEALEETLLIVKEHNLGKIIADLAKGFHGIYLEGDEKPASSSRRARDDEEEEEEAPKRRSSSSSRGGSKTSSRSSGGRSRNRSDDEEHPDGMTCDEADGKCDSVLIRKEGKNDRGRYAGWVCPKGRARGDGHGSVWDD